MEYLQLQTKVCFVGEVKTQQWLHFCSPTQTGALIREPSLKFVQCAEFLKFVQCSSLFHRYRAVNSTLDRRFCFPHGEFCTNAFIKELRYGRDFSIDRPQSDLIGKPFPS